MVCTIFKNSEYFSLLISPSDFCHAHAQCAMSCWAQGRNQRTTQFQRNILNFWYQYYLQFLIEDTLIYDKIWACWTFHFELNALCKKSGLLSCSTQFLSQFCKSHFWMLDFTPHVLSCQFFSFCGLFISTSVHTLISAWKIWSNIRYLEFV